MGDLRLAATVVGLVLFGVGPVVAGPVFAPAEVDVSALPVNPLRPPDHVAGTTGLLIAETTYGLPAADYTVRTGVNLALYVMGAYEIPADERRVLAATVRPAATPPTPAALALKAELGHLPMGVPAGIGPGTGGVMRMPPARKQLDGVPDGAFLLRESGDGLREVFRHLR